MVTDVNTAPGAGALVPRKRIYGQLYVQVLAAIVLGALVGHFFPTLGASLKPAIPPCSSPGPELPERTTGRKRPRASRRLPRRRRLPRGRAVQPDEPHLRPRLHRRPRLPRHLRLRGGRRLLRRVPERPPVRRRRRPLPLARVQGPLSLTRFVAAIAAISRT